MRKKLNRYLITLLSVFLTLILTFAGPLFKIELTGAQQFIIFATGLMISLAIHTIEREVGEAVKSLLNRQLKELRQGFELYYMLSSIGDKDLQGEVIKLLRNLNVGEIPPGLAELRMRSLAKKINSSLFGSDYRPQKQALLSWWQSGIGKTWFEINLEATKRGVTI